MELSKKSFLARSGTSIFLIFTLSTAQAGMISDLLITEVMVNPSQVSDTNGEWFELFNPTTDAIDLNGIFILYTLFFYYFLLRISSKTK